MRTHIQKFGKTLMGPLSIIVASGLLLGIVSILQNPAIVGSGITESMAIQIFVKGINDIVGMMFGLLPLLFAISVAIGLAKEDKEIAAFSVVIAFFIFHVTIRYILSLNNITEETMTIENLMMQGKTQVEAFELTNAYDVMYGIFTYRMGIFSGILVGLWTAIIHNRFHTQKLPVAFSFFAGNRFVPIMIVLTVPFLSIIAYFVWPYFAMAINGLGALIAQAGIFGTFIYGFTERLLLPTGLHHILNQLIRFTPIGGTAVVAGEPVSGALSIFNAALAEPVRDWDTLRYATRFLTQGTHPFMVFGLPAACYAMYKTAFLENRPKVKGMLFAAAITSLVTGITEPIEFAFIFISPILWLFHAFMAGLSFMLMSLAGVAVGNAGGGLIDLVIFGVLQGLDTRWYLVVALGLAYAVAYYYMFTFIILKFNVPTPGREVEATAAEISNVDADDVAFGEAILQAIGGKENVSEIDNCISRLRLVLKDTDVVDEARVKATGAMGMRRVDKNNVQIIYGAQVEAAARALKDTMKQ